jgi:hypothetical protein
LITISSSHGKFVAEVVEAYDNYAAAEAGYGAGYQSLVKKGALYSLVSPHYLCKIANQSQSLIGASEDDSALKTTVGSAESVVGQANRRVKKVTGWSNMGDRVVKVTDGGGMSTMPLVDGTAYKTKPQSPLYYDLVPHLRSIHVENDSGMVSVRFWRSMSTADPANQAAIDAAIAGGTAIPQPDLSSMRWHPLTNIEHGIQFGLGVTPVPDWVVAGARNSRWLKIDPIYGPFENVEFHPTLAAG